MPEADSPRGTPPHLTDEEFVAQLTRIQGSLHAFLTSLLAGQSCVDDVAQLTNITLWKKRTTFEAGTNFAAWAFAVARWEARHWISSQKRHEWLLFSEDVSELLAKRYSEENSPPNPVAIEHLRACLAKLKERDRRLVIDHHQHGLPLAECAARFDLGAESLKVILFRIRQNLRRCVEARAAVELARS